MWMSEIRRVSRLQSVREIVDLLDHKSNWVDGEGVSHQSKWYQFQQGHAVPSKALASKVKARLPKLGFDIHHPAWSILRKPALCERSVDRLVNRMPTSWRETLRELKHDHFGYRRISLDLVDRYKLDQLGYLDALLLFLVCSKWSKMRKSDQCPQYQRIQLALPLIYVHDPFWVNQDVCERSSSLAAIARSVPHSSSLVSIQFPEWALVPAIRFQEAALKSALKSKQLARNSFSERVRFLAMTLSADPYSAYTRALSAFHTEPGYTLLTSTANGYHSRYGQLAWRGAWNDLCASMIARG